MTVATGEDDDELDEVVMLPRMPAISEAMAAAWVVVSDVDELVVLEVEDGDVVG